MKQKFLWILFSAIFVLTFSGCQDKNKPQQEPPTTADKKIKTDKSGPDEEGYRVANIKLLTKLPMKEGTSFTVRQGGNVIAEGEVTGLQHPEG